MFKAAACGWSPPSSAIQLEHGPIRMWPPIANRLDTGFSENSNRLLTFVEIGFSELFLKKNHTSIDATKLECLSVTLLPTQASKIFDTEKQVLGVNKNCVNKTPRYCPSGILFVSQINESKIVGSNPLDTRETEDESKS